MPKVVLVCPFFNEARFLPDVVSSINNQKFDDFEVIFVDDLSSDDGSSIIHENIKQPYKIISNNVRSGPSVSISKAIQMSDSEYIARIDADDIMSPMRLSMQLDLMTQNPDVGLCGASAVKIDLNRNKIGFLNPPRSIQDCMFALNFYNPIISSTAFFRRKPSKNFDFVYYDPRTDPTEDFALAIRFGRVSKIVNIGNVLLQYRVKGNGITGSNRKRQLERHLELIEYDYFKDLPSFRELETHASNILRLLWITRNLKGKEILRNKLIKRFGFQRFK